MQLPIYQVDAFTDRIFAGNPAAICPLGQWLPDTTMQAIAAENNLSETAFLVREGDAFALRWFTPTVEVDLCGHATLASAFVVLNILEPGRAQVAFRTLKAGTLTVTRDQDMLAMDFPSRPASAAALDQPIADALGKKPLEVHAAQDLMVVYAAPEDVAALAPDFRAVTKLPYRGVIVTAPGADGVDFVSRFFAPGAGIDEDPVTGSAHCTLIPYWAARLAKKRLQARQLSARGGSITCTLNGDRVGLAGKAALYMQGTINI